ncbi:MAG: glycosyltransferase family 4 protein [Rhodocyclaceae bacterium]|nr:glycosyltransferase family 4 protein [Rhodocyclaceae bacterium]
MKILYHHRIASKDGQIVHVEEIVNALRELGHEVLLVAPAQSQSQEFGGTVGWVEKLKASLPKALYEILEMAYSIPAYVRLARAVREFRPDGIYERYNLYFFSGIWAKWRFHLPFLLEVNSPIAEERAKYDGLALMGLARWGQRLVWKNADYALPVTQVLAGSLLAAGVRPEALEVIHNGINETHFRDALDRGEAKRRLGLSGKVVLGFTGFVRDWHGLDRVIRWMAKAGDDVQLLVVGDGPAHRNLEKLADELGVSDRVKFTGLVQRDAIPDLVAAFDVALQPAVTPYASPLKLFEYLAMGCPVLAPREPNLLEILTEGENSVLFDAADDASFEAGLGRLCGDEALRLRLGEGARLTIQKRGYTWRRNAERIVELFRRCQARNAGGVSRAPVREA